MKGMMDLPSFDIFIASLSAPLNANQWRVGWVCRGIAGWPLVLPLKSGLSRAAPNASFSPEIQELRARHSLECHCAGTVPPESLGAQLLGAALEAAGPGKRDEPKEVVQLWLGCLCPVQMCWLSLCKKLCHLSSLPFQLPPLHAVPIWAFLF